VLKAAKKTADAIGTARDMKTAIDRFGRRQ
jgi:hypothetical protein